MSAELLDIKQLSKRLMICESTARKRMQEKLIPQPIKRRNSVGKLQWRKSDIDKFLKSTTAANDEDFSPNSIISEKRIEEIVRKAIREEFSALLYEFSQTPNISNDI